MGMDRCLYSGIMEVHSIYGNGLVSVQRNHEANLNLWYRRVSVERDHGSDFSLWEWIDACKAGSWK